MNIILSMKIKIWQTIHKLGLKNKKFSIISNNCWGGYVYQRYGLQYRTPFIGLYIFAPDYIKMLKSLEKYLKKEITFIEPNESKYKNELIKTNRLGKYPIGLLEDIELHFLHYKNEKEALEKWNRRLKRLDYNKMLVKFSDNYLCSKNLIIEFDNLKFKNKLCISANDYNLKSVVQYDIYKEKGYVENEWAYDSKYIDIKKY